MARWKSTLPGKARDIAAAPWVYMTPKRRLMVLRYHCDELYRVKGTSVYLKYLGLCTYGSHDCLIMLLDCQFNMVYSDEFLVMFPEDIEVAELPDLSIRCGHIPGVCDRASIVKMMGDLLAADHDSMSHHEGN